MQPEPNVKYKLIDISDSEAVIETPQGKRFTSPRATPSGPRVLQKAATSANHLQFLPTPTALTPCPANPPSSSESPRSQPRSPSALFSPNRPECKGRRARNATPGARQQFCPGCRQQRQRGTSKSGLRVGLRLLQKRGGCSPERRPGHPEPARGSHERLRGSGDQTRQAAHFRGPLQGCRDDAERHSREQYEPDYQPARSLLAKIKSGDYFNMTITPGSSRMSSR